jgi:hypothetical protein
MAAALGMADSPGGWPAIQAEVLLALAGNWPSGGRAPAGGHRCVEVRRRQRSSTEYAEPPTFNVQGYQCKSSARTRICSSPSAPGDRNDGGFRRPGKRLSAGGIKRIETERVAAACRGTWRRPSSEPPLSGQSQPHTREALDLAVRLFEAGEAESTPPMLSGRADRKSSTDALSGWWEAAIEIADDRWSDFVASQGSSRGLIRVQACRGQSSGVCPACQTHRSMDSHDESPSSPHRLQFACGAY